MLSKGILLSRSFKRVTVNCYKVPVSHFHALKSPIHRVQRNRHFIEENVIYKFFIKHESTSSKDSVYRIINEADIDMTNTSTTADESLDESLLTSALPDIEQPITDVVVELNTLGEQTLSSLGLGCWYTPVGIIQKIIEYFHVTFDIPWWNSIFLTVVIARLLLFPIVIASQKHTVKTHNIMPKFQELQTEMADARACGDQFASIKASQKLALFMKGNSFNPAKGAMFAAAQAPIFLSFFLGIRAMANAPVPSMMHGGILWFGDLTVPDQFYGLPIITVATLWVTLEVGLSAAKLQSNSLMKFIPYGIKIMPFIVFPFIMNFPSGMLVYWATNNLVSLCQVSVLRIPKVRDFFGIEIKQKHTSEKSNKKSVGIIKDIKQTWKNMKITKEIDERERLDQIGFQRAGRAPPVKTYKTLKEAQKMKAKA